MLPLLDGEGVFLSRAKTEGGRRGRLLSQRCCIGAIEPDKVARHALDRCVIATGEISDPRALYLDHPRTQVSQLTCGKGGRHCLLKGDHRNAFKWEHQYDLGRPRVCSAR